MSELSGETSVDAHHGHTHVSAHLGGGLYGSQADNAGLIPVTALRAARPSSRARGLGHEPPAAVAIAGGCGRQSRPVARGVARASFALAVWSGTRSEPELHRHELDLGDRLIATGLDRQDLDLVLGARLEELRMDGDTGRGGRQVDTEYPQRPLPLDDDLIADDLNAGGLVARLSADHGIVGSNHRPGWGVTTTGPAGVSWDSVAVPLSRPGTRLPLAQPPKRKDSTSS